MDFLRGKSFLIIAIAFAGISSVCMLYYLQNRESVSVATPTVVANSTTQMVVVAGADLIVGHKLTEKDLKTQTWPKDIVTESHFVDKKQLLGRIIKSDLIVDEPITAPKLLPEGDNISSLIPQGMRGVTVSVRRSDTLIQVLQRGSYVDVMAVGDGEPGMDGVGMASGRDTRVISYSAKVLTVTDTATERNPTRNMEVILLVKNHDAERIVSAMNNGIIELVVRNKHNPILEVF